MAQSNETKAQREAKAAKTSECTTAQTGQANAAQGPEARRSQGAASLEEAMKQSDELSRQASGGRPPKAVGCSKLVDETKGHRGSGCLAGGP